MERFFTLLRHRPRMFRVKYGQSKIGACFNAGQEYNPTWTNEEISQHIIELKCSGHKLTVPPPLPQCQRLICADNQLAVLPPLPQCQELNCAGNQLTSLPPLPQCQKLSCSDNYLISLPSLPKCQILDCFDNQLTTLPSLPLCQQLHCNNNQLPFTQLEEWQIIWRYRSVYYGLKYGRKWYRWMLTQKAKKKRELHLELKYCPDLPFYLEDEYAQHFISSSKVCN